MSELSEREKVGALMRLLEDSFKSNLYISRGDKMVKIGRIYPDRRGFGKEEGRPDIVLWIELDTIILGSFVKAGFPVLVEAEESGWPSARADYEMFFGKDETTIPMIVVGGDKKDENMRTVPCKIKLSIKQVPTRLVIRKRSSHNST